MSYTELHAAAEAFLVKKLEARGHRPVRELRRDHEVIFDVYDATAKTAWEVLTAKIVRSGHEQDEAIIAKFFRYMLVCPRLRILVVSYDHGELELLHNLGLEHWHTRDGWWSFRGVGGLKDWYYHPGRPAAAVARRIYRAMVRFAPLREWTAEKRRGRHPKAPVAAAFAKMTKQLGLPENFLIGMWRDYRLMWVWKLEKALPEWAKKFGKEK